MVISGGNFKPDTLKPKEVVSLLLDDDEIVTKCMFSSDLLCDFIGCTAIADALFASLVTLPRRSTKDRGGSEY